MEGGSYEMHSEDDQVQGKNTKRIVKTPAQVLALEKLYNEDKNPSMATKKQLADLIGLTEKQVNGWFCHRRLKDKRENHTIGRQDRSSGVIQERTSGHKQDSCGSTKLGEDNTREVESERLTQQERIYEQSGKYAPSYNNLDNASSRSSSSSSDMNGDQIGPTISKYPIQKFSSELKSVKARSGPSGYLKMKAVQIENSAIIAVKRQLGKHFREDGPPLDVDFDPLPPGAFEESPIQDPVEETYCSEEDMRPASPDVPKVHQHPKFNKGYEYNSPMASHSPNMDRMRYKTTKMSEVPHNYVHQRSIESTPLAHNGTYYPQRSSSVEFPEGHRRDVHGIESRISRYHEMQLDGEKVTLERKHYKKYNNSGKNIYQGENVEKTSYYAIKGYERHNTLGNGLPRQIAKEGKAYGERRLIDENRIRVEVPLRNDMIAPKRTRDDFHH